MSYLSWRIRKNAQLDAKAAKLGRKLSPKDFDYADWAQLYAAVNVRRHARCPLWKGRISGRWPGQRPWPKTPLSCEVLRRYQAALRIQAAFRGWRFRLSVLFNPNNELGQRWLSARFKRECRFTLMRQQGCFLCFLYVAPPVGPKR
jgi:hypothetical protein